MRNLKLKKKISWDEIKLPERWYGGEATGTRPPERDQDFSVVRLATMIIGVLMIFNKSGREFQSTSRPLFIESSNVNYVMLARNLMRTQIR